MKWYEESSDDSCNDKGVVRSQSIKIMIHNLDVATAANLRGWTWSSTWVNFDWRHHMDRNCNKALTPPLSSPFFSLWRSNELILTTTPVWGFSVNTVLSWWALLRSPWAKHFNIWCYYKLVMLCTCYSHVRSLCVCALFRSWPTWRGSGSTWSRTTLWWKSVSSSICGCVCVGWVVPLSGTCLWWSPFHLLHQWFFSWTAEPVIASKSQESDYASVAKTVSQQVAEYNKCLIESLQSNRSWTHRSRVCVGNHSVTGYHIQGDWLGQKICYQIFMVNCQWYWRYTAPGNRHPCVSKTILKG